MAKDKEKVKVAGTGKKWAVWKTVLVVISSVIFVAGVTLLGIYLAGGLRNPVTPPDDIAFVVDDDLYSADNAQFEVTEDFELVITSSTEQVTERQVRLSFTGSTTTNPSTGTISDGVITVPQIVNIGEPFQVTLNMTRYQELGGQNWIAGGISTLIATSMSNDQADPTSVKIAVDVPVYDIEIELYDEYGNQISQVTELERFYPRAKFLPEKSRYRYSDDAIVAEDGVTVERRTKNVYFEGQSSDNIVFFFNDGDPYFEAGELSTENNFSIVGYTFIHADDQANTLTELETLYQGEQLYNNIITALGDANIGKSNTGTFEIVQASIKSFTVGRSSISVTAGMTSRIAVASSQNADASLGASIISTDDESLEGMLRNVAIRFTRVEGSGIVEANDALNVRGGEEVVIDGNTYIKVNDDVLDYNYSYLDISPMVAGTYNMEVVLLMRDGSDGYRLFEVDGEAVINSIILNVKQNTEAQLSWSNGGTDITIPLQYQNGVVQPALYDLSGFGIVPEGNAYQTVVYFASFENSGGISAEDVLVSWQSGREGDYLVGADIRWLYPFQGSSFSVDGDGEFELYFATVRTINGQIQYNEDGTYQTVQFVSDPITVRVERSLHEDSVTNLTTTLNGNGFDHAGGIYVQEGSTASIDLTFAVDVNSYETFAEVFNQNMLELRVFSVGGQDISTSFTISKGTLTPGEEKDANGTLSYNLAINPSLGLGINEFLTIGTVELTDRDSGLVWRRAVTAGDDNRQITLYSPQPVSITLESNDIELNEQISVVQALTNDGFTTTITQGGESIASSIDELIGKLSVQVIDQIGQTSTLGSWIWATDNESAVTVNGQSFSFRSTNGQEPVSANIWVTYTNYSNITSEARLNLSISSTGVAAITYDNTQILKDAQPPLVDWTDGLGEVSLSKYGAKGKTIRLADLVKLYLDEDKGQEYTTPKFRFNANELYLLEDDVVSLFGATKGIISLTLEEGEVTSDDANEICSVLTSSYVTSLTFKNNFGTSQTLRFEIVDEGLTGAVDIDLNLQILANSTLQTAVNSVEAYAATNIVFRDFSITNNNDTSSTTLTDYLKELYKDRYMYIVQDNSGTGNIYTISKDSAGAVGSVNDDGTITFYDFWDEETREFALRLYLDGINVTNTFAPVATINFTISRNVRVTYTGTAYQILGDNNAIGNYIKVEREVYSETPLLDASYAFASGAPLEITDGTISQSQTYFFDYNEITKTCSLTVSVGGSVIATFDNFAYTLGEGTYGSIAKEFTGTIEVEKYQAGTIQTVANEEGEEVQYLYLTTGNWSFGSDVNGIGDIFPGYNVLLRARFKIEDVPDGVNSAYLSVNTNYTMTENWQANFPNRTSVMTGLDNPNVYIQFEVVSSNNLVVARIVMPLIVSNYGKVFGVFDNYLSNDDSLTDHTKDHKDMSLANILSDANTLIENKIYTEVYAGQRVVVARRMGLNEMFDENKATGLYYLPDDAQVSARVTLITDNEGYREGLLRRVSSGSGLVDFEYNSASGEYSVSLNHLESSESEVYVAVQFALRYADDEQYFTYVLKVLPTVDVKEGVYAYNTPTEYLTPDDNNQIEVDLAQEFGNTTLHNGETRFDYDFEDGAQKEEGVQKVDLKYSYSVESLTLDNDQVLTEESDWSRYISFAVDENEIMRIVVQDLGSGQPLRLQIARVYDGGSDGLAVIGDNGAFRQTYNFTINGSVSYRLNYGTPNSGNLSSSGNDATWDINSITNGWEEGSYTTVAGTLVGGDNPTYYLSNTGVDYYYFASTDVTYDSSGAERGQLGKELKILATAKKIQITINGEQVECFQVPETGTYVKVSDGEKRNSITNVQLLYFTKDATIYSNTNQDSTIGTIPAGEHKAYVEDTDNDTDDNTVAGYYKLAEGQYVEKTTAVVVAGKEFDKDVTTVYQDAQGAQPTDPVLKLSENYIVLCQYRLPITLFSASGSTSTPITGVLQANAWASSGELTDIVADVIYDGSNSILTITPLQYLGSDQTFYISFYTGYGYIGGLTVNVAGSASVTMKEDPDLIAGTTPSIKNLIAKVVFSGVDVTKKNYTVSEVTINSVTTTNKDGEVTYDKDEQDYITWDPANTETSTADTLTLRTSVRDYTADLTITLNYEGQTYTFNHTIEVKSNISQVKNDNVVGLTKATAQTISVGDVVAGTPKEIDQPELFTLKNKNNATFTYSWESNNTGVIEDGDNKTNDGAVTFTPKNVANAGQDVTLMVEVTMTDGELENIFYVRLQIHVVCAGKVTVTYPVIGETKLQAEYLESTKDSPAEFASAQSFFFGSKAVFAGNIRVQLADVSLDESGEQTSTPVTQPIAGEDPKPSITIIGAQNIDVMQGGTHKNASTGNNEIALSSDLKFVLGNWNDETRKNTDTGEESYVIFRIEYRGYTAEYTVYVQETVYGLSFNGATNNMTAGGDGTEVENFYVENLLSDTKIFANNRMLKYTVREGAPTGTYYLGFTTAENQETPEKYLSFVITESDRGQTKYIELGKPYKSFTGIYSRTGETGPYTPLPNDSYFDGTPTLTARVTFTYTAGENRYEVPYATFSEQIKFTAGNQSEQTLADYRISQKTNNLGNTQTLKDFIFVLGNGQIATDGANKEFANTYSYTLALDVGATTYAHDGNFPIEEIDARDEINLVETVGLIRQSTGEAYSREMFNENRTETSGNYLSFSMVDPTNPTGNDTSILLGLYNYMNNASKTTVDEDVQNAFAIAATGNYNYMAYSPVNEENGKDETAYDIRAWGQGAPIGGTIVVGKLTYNVKTSETEPFTQDFYVVFRILPAYTISVNGSAMTVEDTTYLSNITNPYEATITESSDEYSIDLTATSSPLVVGYEHETTASNLLNQFDKEVTTGERVNGVEYNNKLNAKNKNVFPSGTDNDNEHFWSNSSDTTYKCSRGAGTTLAPAQVHFADQKYRIKMTDVYGYYFYFYFTLKATGSAPTLQTTNITLTEGDTFDFTTSSTVISITGATGEEADQTLTMRSASHSAPTTQINNAVTIELSGFSFWFFDDYYTKPESNGRPAYLQESDSAYIGAEIDGQSGSHYEIPTEYKTYLEPSTYNNIAVSEITLLGPNGEELGCEVDLAESAGGNRLKVGVGEILEHATGSAAQLDTSGGLTYTVPTIAGSAPWEGSGSMSATMAVTFMYDPDGTSGTTDDNEEYCVVDIPITLKRKTQITSPNSYVRDGEAFTLTEYIGLQKGTSNITPTFIDDTLEVYVPANSGVTLEIYITDSEGNNRAPEEGYASITTKTYHTRQQTYYYSISQTVGRNLQAGDLIYVRATSASSATVNAGNANSPFEGYAIGYSAGVNEGNNNKTILGGGLNVWLDSNPTEDPQGPTFTAVTIKQDKIGIPDTVHFTNGNYAEVQQYYVINAEIGGTQVSYQYTKTYRVTWAYSNVTVNDIGRVGATKQDDDSYIISWKNILNKLGFSYLGEGNVTKPISDNKTVSAKQFRLEVTEAGSGSASVDEDGNITTSTNFNQQNEYITLVFYRKASGADGLFGTADDVAATQPFLTFRFQIYQESTI